MEVVFNVFKDSDYEIYERLLESHRISETERLKEALENADAVIIGAGAGLSASAGFTYTGRRLKKLFMILLKNTGFRICIPEAFIPLIL